jgi:hypothetical protein
MDRAEPSKAPEVKAKAATGLNLVWENALKQYESDNKVTINRTEHIIAADFGDADDGLKKATILFDEQRHPHPEEKKAKFIAAVGGCLEWVDKSVGFVTEHVEGTVTIIMMTEMDCD